MRLAPGSIEDLKVAALLHDIGKIGIEDSILRKPTELTKCEWDKIKQHPWIGIRIMYEVAFNPVIKNAILHHHEKYDGGGYPDNLMGSETSLDAYILGAADAYDAMTSDRPYRKALSRRQAIEVLRKEKGSQFHPIVADVLIRILEKEDREAKKEVGEDVKGLVNNDHYQYIEEAAMTAETHEEYSKL